VIVYDVSEQDRRRMEGDGTMISLHGTVAGEVEKDGVISGFVHAASGERKTFSGIPIDVNDSTQALVIQNGKLHMMRTAD
jgi:hypothetical protein